MSTTFFRPFLSYKYLLLQLIQREIKARYKQSIIGYFWVLLNPLAQMLVYTFVFSIVFRFPSDVPYPLFLFSALLPWTFLQSTITTATTSLISNGVLLKKVAFPREIIIYSVVIAKMIDFFFASLVFITMMVLFNVPFASTTYLFFPLFFGQMLFTTGMSYILSSANLFYRDIQYLTNLALMILMYLSPVVYPLSLVPVKYVWLYKLNPLVGFVEGYRSVLFGFPIETSIITWAFGISFFIFVLGFIIFKKAEPVFADIV